MATRISILKKQLYHSERSNCSERKSYLPIRFFRRFRLSYSTTFEGYAVWEERQPISRSHHSCHEHHASSRLKSKHQQSYLRRKADSAQKERWWSASNHWRDSQKCANKYATEKLAIKLAPFHLGVGVPGGTEATIHALRRYAEVLHKLDFTNAFNTLHRDEMLDAIWREVPEYITSPTWRTMALHNCNLTTSQYCLKRDRSKEIQWDHLNYVSPFINQPLLVSLSSELKIGFLDDITLFGHKNIVIKDINTITDNTVKLGLHLNAAKCEVVYGDS